MEIFMEPKGKARRAPPRGWDEDDYHRETRKACQKAADDGDWVLGKQRRIVHSSIMTKRIWPRE